MTIKIIPLSELETDPHKTLTDCCNSGEALVIQMPDSRLIAIQALDPADDDSLVDDLIASNSKFRALLQKSASGRRKPFAAGT